MNECSINTECKYDFRINILKKKYQNILDISDQVAILQFK